jgi:colanic acid/amylovoran biosynthesis glycosyltransferase
MSIDTNKNTIVHYESDFLPLTQIWIYDILCNTGKFNSIFLSRNLLNLDLFPFENLFSLANHSNFERMIDIGLFKTLGYFPYFKKKCEEFNCKLFHVHFGYNGVKSIGLKKKLDIPMICSFYGVDAFRFPYKNDNQKKLRKLFEVVDKVLVLGPYMQNQLIDLGCSPEKILIQHLGVNTNKIIYKARAIPVNRPINFLCAASFVEKKGYDITIKAFSRIKDKIDFKLHIIGDGPLRKEITDMIKLYRLSDYVVLYGYRDYSFFINSAYSCDVFIQASKTAKDNDKEGTPMALVDVMTTGMPVITTYHSDIPEIVNCNNGFLAKEGDVEDLTKAILMVYNNVNGLSKLGEQGRLHIEKNFNSVTQGARLEKIYDSLLT